VTLANFHSDGKEDNDSDMLNNLHSGYFNIGAASRKSRGLIHYNFLLENRIISSNQSGFTPGDSAINQLLYITNEFGKALDDGKEVRVVSIQDNNGP
jgi:hypothetical protein